MMSRSISSRVNPAEPAPQGKRMLDFANAPTFLVEHLVVDHTTYGQFGVLFDRIVLEVLVAAIAIKQALPGGIALSNSTAKSDGHRGGLDIQGFVVFDDADGFAHI